MAKDNSTGKTKGFYERGQAIFDRIPGMPEDDAPAPSRLYDLREWLLSQIDGSEETRGDDSLISHFINQIDALPSEMGVMGLEPRGCPTPGSCSAVEELADLKQRILPQFQGRAERAEKARQMAVAERDEMLEKLIVCQTTIENLHDVIDGMRGAARSATGATDAEVDEFVRVARTFSDEHCQNALVAELRRVYHALFALRDAAPVEERAPDRPDWARQLPGAELYDRAHGYDRTASLNAGK